MTKMAPSSRIGRVTMRHGLEGERQQLGHLVGPGGIAAQQQPCTSRARCPRCGGPEHAGTQRSQQENGGGQILAAGDLALLARLLPPLRRRSFCPLAAIIRHGRSLPGQPGWNPGGCRRTCRLMSTATVIVTKTTSRPTRIRSGKADDQDVELRHQAADEAHRQFRQQQGQQDRPGHAHRQLEDDPEGPQHEGQSPSRARRNPSAAAPRRSPAPTGRACGARQPPGTPSRLPSSRYC